MRASYCNGRGVTRRRWIPGWLRSPGTRGSLGLVSNAVDFNAHRIDELAHDGGSRRAVRAEKLGVDFVHGFELASVFKEDGALHNVGQRGSAGFQNGPDIL